MGTYTTNYNLFMPSIGEQGWGDLVNGNFTTIDTTMKSLSNRITAVENEVNGALSCTSVTTSGKVTANGGVGTTSLTTSSTITSTGLITANGGVKGNLTGNVTGNVTGIVNAPWKVSTSNIRGGWSIGTLSSTNITVNGQSGSGTILSFHVPNTGTVAGFGIKLGTYNTNTITISGKASSSYAYATLTLYWNGSQVWTFTGGNNGYFGFDRVFSANVTPKINATNTLTYNVTNGYTDSTLIITPNAATIYVSPN